MCRSTCRTRATRPSPRAAAEEVVEILEHSRGRAFVLFTSYQQMRLVYDRVSLEIDYPTLLQGTGPRNALLEEFRATPNCVLFATSSFWQGVDVPGEQLSCVIIDKLPFAVPNDPVVDARIEDIRKAGRQSVLRLPDPAGGHRAEAGFRTADPQPDATAACWSCWTTGSPSSATARCFSTACRITDSPPNWQTWRSFSMFEVPWKRHSPPATPCATITGKCENVHGHNYRVPGDAGRRRSWIPSGCWWISWR